MTTVAGRVNVRELTLEVMRETRLTSPQAIADEVYSRITPDTAMDAVSQMIVGYVRGVVGTVRTSHGPTTPPSVIRDAGRTSRTPAQPSTSGRRPDAPSPSRSPKVSAIREGWQRYLDNRVHVAGGQWKFFKDLTEKDFRFAADERRSNAERNLKEAHRYEAWAQLVAEHAVETFKDLPIEVQMKAIGTVE